MDLCLDIEVIIRVGDYKTVNFVNTGVVLETRVCRWREGMGGKERGSNMQKN